MPRSGHKTEIPLHGRLGMELVTLGKEVRRMLSRRAAQLGVSDGEWGILIHLRRLGGNISQKELAYSLGSEPTAMVRLLVNLEKSGHVLREIDPRDARGRLLHLTPSGIAQADALIAMADGFERDLVATLQGDEIITTLRVLDKMRAQLTQSEQALRR